MISPIDTDNGDELESFKCFMLPVRAVHACSLVASCLLVNAEAVVAVARSHYTFNHSKVGYVVLSRFLSHDVTI